MATIIEATGKVTESNEFYYNTVYKPDNKPNTDVDPTGNSLRASMMNEFNADKYRTGKIVDEGVGDIYGEVSSRSETAFGAVTETGNFSYNGGLSSANNIPDYLTDKEDKENEIRRSEEAFTINKNKVLTLRNANDGERDGLKDDGI